VSTQAKGTFKIDSWDEQPYADKLSRAQVKATYSGDIEGQGETEWLMCYREDKTADFVGFQRIVGRLGGRSGSFVFQSTGAFDGKEATGPLAIVQGSGTGELAGIAGTGTFSAPMGGEPSLSLDYDFE
jgi:Protein of unknown function (DUF3224)